VKILKLRRLRKVGTSQRVDTSDDTIMEDLSNQGRMIYELDRDEGAMLMNEKEQKKANPEEESSAKTPTETKSKDKGKGIMVEESNPMKKKQQVELDEAYARKLHEELNQDIDWEVAIDHVKQKAKENPYKAAKRRRLNEEAKDVEELKKNLEIMPDEDDDVYTEATSLARKRRPRVIMELSQERFSTSKPNNFSDDYLLTILKAMFGRPD
nr:hypothetical protein [Tanacetum cinerariifolium]